MPDHRIVPLADLDDVGLQSLALLHQSVMHTLLTDLGLPFILRYYRSARTDESVIGYCLISLSGDVLGWVVGSPDPIALNGRLRAPARWFAGQILRLAITRPSVLWQLLVSVSSSSKQMATEGSLELTYLGTAAHARGGGLARSLLQAFIAASRTAGYRVVELSVEQDNSAAVGLYASFGFVGKRTFREGRFERCRMELVL
jgi:ribosomal protein S18 acetylase RimI-like enzyme